MTMMMIMIKIVINIPGQNKINKLQNTHTGHGTHTSESTNVKLQNIQHGK
jgi:hypothetical protein